MGSQTLILVMARGEGGGVVGKRKARLMFENDCVICKYAKCNIHSLWRKASFRNRFIILRVISSSLPPSPPPPPSLLLPQKVSLPSYTTIIPFYTLNDCSFLQSHEQALNRIWNALILCIKHTYSRYTNIVTQTGECFIKINSQQIVCFIWVLCMSINFEDNSTTEEVCNVGWIYFRNENVPTNAHFLFLSCNFSWFPSKRSRHAHNKTLSPPNTITTRISSLLFSNTAAEVICLCFYVCLLVVCDLINTPCP